MKKRIESFCERLVDFYDCLDPWEFRDWASQIEESPVEYFMKNLHRIDIVKNLLELEEEEPDRIQDLIAEFSVIC